MSLKPKLAWLVALVALLATASPVAAEEEGTEPLLDAATTTTVTVPSLVSGLMVIVEADSNGSLVSVELHAAGEPESPAPDGFVATKVDSRRVRFEHSTGVRVEVKAKHDKLETKFRTATLEELLGTHTWTGDVLGEEVTVTFTIGGDDLVGPTLTIDSVVPDIATISGPSTKAEPGEIEVEAKLKFENDVGQRAELKIEVEVHTAAADHDPGQASLKLKLKIKDEKSRVPLEALAAAPQGWSGTLCDGTPASATWLVDDTGAISNIVVLPTAEVEVKHDGFKVRFGDDSELEVKVKVKDDGIAEVKVKPKIKCDNAADPLVNTDIVDDDHGKDDERPEDEDD